jgi:hypothetical protein
MQSDMDRLERRLDRWERFERRYRAERSRRSAQLKSEMTKRAELREKHWADPRLLLDEMGWKLKAISDRLSQNPE